MLRKSRKGLSRLRIIGYMEIEIVEELVDEHVGSTW